MKLFGFYITRTDWHYKFVMKEAWSLLREKHIAELELKLSKQSETFTGKDGRLRFKHNGQFAPDNRSAFKKTCDQLRHEVACKKYELSDCVMNYNDIKEASKIEGFGR